MKLKTRHAKIAAVASFAVLAAACEKKYEYTRGDAGVEILREGPITINSAKPKETKADKKKADEEKKKKEKEKKPAEEKKE